MAFDEFLLGFRAVVYLATFLTIASYQGHGARWRPGVSLFAVGLAGSSFMFAVQIATAWSANVFNGPQWAPTIYCLCVFGLVLRCRGNLAKLLPRFKQRANA